MFKNIIVIILVMSGAAFLCNRAHAASVPGLIDEGNKSWLSGDYEEAISKYDEAAVDDPESPYIYFNKGAALYKKGDYQAATDEFEKAALKSKEPLMESKSRFNLGNCAYREAERQMDSDLKKSLEYCQTSIRHFQDAVRLDPGLKPAAENIEIVRLVMKNILDEIKKQEEEAQKREQAAKENTEKIKELIRRQESALKKNRDLSKSKQDQLDKKKELNKLADEQGRIADDTKKLAESVRQQASGMGQAEDNPAVTHLNNAVKEQEAAEGNLKNDAAGDAAQNQENAIKELKDAMKPPEQEGNNQKQQDQQGQQQQQNQQGTQNRQEQEEGSDNKESSEESAQQEQEQKSFKKADEAAQDILDEERENKKRRKIRPAGGYRDVEKDW